MAQAKAILLNSVKIEGAPEYIYLLQLEINHEVNKYATAKLVLAVKEEKGTEYLNQANENKIKITAKTSDAQNPKDVNLFHGCITNLILEKTPEYNLMTFELCDTTCLLNLKRDTCSFQKLDAKHEDILKKVYDKTGTIKLENVTDKAIEKIVMRLNETEWEFTQRMAGVLGAPIFTNIFTEKPVVTLGVPAPQHTAEVDLKQLSHSFADSKFQFIKSNPKAKAESLNLINEDFASLKIGGCLDYLYLGDKVKLDKKEYFVKDISAHFVDGIFISSYELVGKTTAFFSPIIKQKNIAGRVFVAVVKKVEKDTIQAHLINVDKDYDSSGTAKFPFATAYSSADGSGWYVMPEENDYVRILFPSEDTKDAFALSSINTAPLKEPKNKSLKAPGGREILLTDKGVEIIAEHQKTFIQLDKDKGINIVSAKDIVVSADGNINFDAKGKIQMISQKEIIAQSGRSHIKILSNQIAVGGSNVIVGE